MQQKNVFCPNIYKGFWKMFKKICSLVLVFATLCTLLVTWVSAETAIINLFDTATMIEGYYTGDGKRGVDGQYRSSAPIPVSQGDVITFGAALTEQGFQLVTMSNETTYNGQYRLQSGCSVLYNIDGTYSIMQFTVPQNVKYIRLIAITEKAGQYLATKNRPFTLDEWNAFFNCDYTNLFNLATAKPGYVTETGSVSNDNQYRVSSPIAV